jgi:hypothetical protein
MIIDGFLEFSDSQAVTATAVGTNVIDLSVARSVGNGVPMAVCFSVVTAADQTSSDEDYTFDLEYATNAAQSTGAQLMGRRIFESGTPSAPAQNADLLVAGFVFAIPLPPTTAGEVGQFVGIRYTTAGTSPSITVNAWLTPLSDVSQFIAYPDNVEIS